MYGSGIARWYWVSGRLRRKWCNLHPIDAETHDNQKLPAIRWGLGDPIAADPVPGNAGLALEISGWNALVIEFQKGLG